MKTVAYDDKAAKKSDESKNYFQKQREKTWRKVNDRGTAFKGTYKKFKQKKRITENRKN